MTTRFAPFRCFRRGWSRCSVRTSIGHARRSQGGVPVWPFYRPLIETLEASLREDLGDAFEGLYEVGRGMSEDEAANFALRKSEELGAQSAEDSASRNRPFSARVP